MPQPNDHWDALWVNARLATMRADATAPYGGMEDAAIAAKDGRIAWLGAMTDLPSGAKARAASVIDAQNRWITPALIDCHTHLVFAGDRAREFEMRLGGASYEEIAKAGGGILSTVTATRAASLDDLAAAARPRLDALQREGVATVEIKSGYGLTLDDELKMLRAARQLCDDGGVRIRTTFLGAHATPPEFADADAYIDHVCAAMIPAVAKAGLADAVDAFCEGIGFSRAQCRRVLEAAKRHGLAIKLHAEQLSDLGGAAMAAALGALSVDHLEYLNPADIDVIADAGTVGVLLPGAFYFLKETQAPPVEALRAAGVPIALATDLNPGSSPIASPLAIMNMGCVLFGLTPEEALAGFTRHAAAALGLEDETGALSEGLAADFAIWNVEHLSELSYWVGARPLHALIKDGRSVC
ncbi:MAG: imidazolonepropionase [Pseudomonadota bacterium]